MEVVSASLHCLPRGVQMSAKLELHPGVLTYLTSVSIVSTEGQSLGLCTLLRL